MRRQLRDANENRITQPHLAVVVAAFKARDFTFMLMRQRLGRANLPRRPAGLPDYFSGQARQDPL